jgi:hypothetical protein
MHKLLDILQSRKLLFIWYLSEHLDLEIPVGLPYNRFTVN